MGKPDYKPHDQAAQLFVEYFAWNNIRPDIVEAINSFPEATCRALLKHINDFSAVPKKATRVIAIFPKTTVAEGGLYFEDFAWIVSMLKPASPYDFSEVKELIKKTNWKPMRYSAWIQMKGLQTPLSQSLIWRIDQKVDSLEMKLHDLDLLQEADLKNALQEIACLIDPKSNFFE